MILLDLLPQTKLEAVSDAIAVGAISSPLWLHAMSDVAKDLLPWFGIAWLVVQTAEKIYAAYHKYYREK